jgi:hypothetical protein
MPEVRTEYSKRLVITTGICGADQESSFMNATLQSAGKGEDGKFALDFSIATHVDVPADINTEEDLRDYLHHLFSDAHETVSFEIQIGPFGDVADAWEDD